MLLHFMIAGSSALVLIALLAFIWSRRDGLWRLLQGVSTGSTGVGGHDYLPHSGDCNDTSGDGGGGDC